MSRLLAFAVCTFAAAGAVAASTLVTPRDIAPRGVRVRNERSTNDERNVLYTLPFGQRLRTEGPLVNGWYPVVAPDGRSGWACAQLLRVVQADEIEFTVRFIDVAGGEAAIVNVGQTAVLIDGGDDPAYLAQYLRQGGLLRDPMKLIIVTHRDHAHWEGFSRLARLLGKDSQQTGLWLPESDPQCKDGRYDQFVDSAKHLPRVSTVMHGALFADNRDAHHHPRNPSVFDVRLPFAPEIDLTLLHGGASATGAAKDCEARADNASLVFALTIGESRFLFTSDITGRDPGTSTQWHVPKYGEGTLLELEKKESGLLTADVLTVPHHGADTSSTPEFIKCVAPRKGALVAVIPATHHMAEDVVIKRYRKKKAIIFRTDEHGEYGNDHVLCVKRKGERLDCRNELHPSRLPPPPIPPPHAGPAGCD